MLSFAPRCLVLALCLFIPSFTAHAEIQKNPYQAKLNYSTASLAKIASRKARQPREDISSFRISGFVPGLGSFRAKLKERRNFSATDQIVLLRGKYFNTKLDKELPLAASLFKESTGSQKLLLLFQKPSHNSAHTRYFEVAVENALNIKNSKTQIRSVPNAFLQKRSCDTDLAQAAHFDSYETASASQFQRSAATSLRIVEFATEADAAWIGQYGSNANAQIQSIMNAAELIYEEELGVTFALNTQDLNNLGLSSSTNPVTLLADFRSKNNSQDRLGDADLFHLFTARDLDGDVAGIAYLQVVCSSASFSYGLTQRTHPALDYLIFAHEVGHNMGADHPEELLEPDPAASLMSAYIDASLDSFSTFSRNQIAQQIEDYGDICLASTSVTPSPTPTPTASGPTPTTNPNATPTSIPSATPTSTTEGGGGGKGNSPGEDPLLPSVGITGSLSRSGTLTAAITLSGGVLRDSCATYIQISKDSSFKITKNVQVAEGSNAALNINRSIPFKINPFSSGKKISTAIFIRAVYSCEGIGQSAPSQKLKLNTSRVKGKTINKTNYQKKLWQALQS